MKIVVMEPVQGMYDSCICVYVCMYNSVYFMHVVVCVRDVHVVTTCVSVRTVHVCMHMWKCVYDHLYM